MLQLRGSSFANVVELFAVRRPIAHTSVPPLLLHVEIGAFGLLLVVCSVAPELEVHFRFGFRRVDPAPFATAFVRADPPIDVGRFA